MLCGFSGTNYLSGNLLSIQNVALSTLQCFVAYYYETPDLKGLKFVRPSQFKNNIRGGQFDQRVFWFMVFNSFMQGSLIFWISIFGYNQKPVTMNGKMVDFNVSGVFAFCLIMVVVNIKLQLDLNNKSAAAFFVSLVSFGILYSAARVLSIGKVSIFFNDDLGGTLPQMLLSMRAAVYGILATLLVLLPDILRKWLLV